MAAHSASMKAMTQQQIAAWRINLALGLCGISAALSAWAILLGHLSWGVYPAFVVWAWMGWWLTGEWRNWKRTMSELHQMAWDGTLRPKMPLVVRIIDRGAFALAIGAVILTFYR
jgi:hypothetical protein